jgi:hypothetical protein
MTIYLTIITTILVLTQIIRVTQNAIQLRKYTNINTHNTYILKTYERINTVIDQYFPDGDHINFMDFPVDDEDNTF